MLAAAIRSRAHPIALARHSMLQQTPCSPLRALFSSSSSPSSSSTLGLLNVDEVQKILNDVKADDVKVIPVNDLCGWTDFMVIATGRSTWHVKNIAQALIYKARITGEVNQVNYENYVNNYKAKQKQVGSKRMLLPSVEGDTEGNWIVVDSGTVIIHALDEKARAYCNLESLWGKEKSHKHNDPNQEIEKAIVKTRRINNSKKPMKAASQS